MRYASACFPICRTSPSSNRCARTGIRCRPRRRHRVERGSAPRCMTATPSSSDSSDLSVTHSLLDRHDAASILGYRHGRAISTAEFLDDVARVAAAMPAGRHVLNTCVDRYCFDVGFAAILVSGRVSLLPSTLTHETIAQL